MNIEPNTLGATVRITRHIAVARHRNDVHFEYASGAGETWFSQGITLTRDQARAVGDALHAMADMDLSEPVAVDVVPGVYCTQNHEHSLAHGPECDPR